MFKNKACKLANCEVCGSTGQYCEICDDYYILSERKFCEKDTICRISNC